MIECTPINNIATKGYTSNGSVGDRGNCGYNVYYTPLDSSVNIENRVKNSKTLSYISEDFLTGYTENDIIIDTNATMYMVSGQGQNIKINEIGSIINQSTIDSKTQDFAPINVSIQVTEDSYPNLHAIGEIHTGTPFCRYKEVFSRQIPMFVINISNLDFSDNMIYNLIIYHKCGLTQRIQVDQNTSEIYVEKKYFEMIPDKEDGLDTPETYIQQCKIYLEVYNKLNDTTYRFKVNNIS